MGFVSYQTASEVSALLASVLGESDQRVLAWNAASAADRDAAALRASEIMDALNYRGRPIDPEQPRAWPRTMSAAGDPIGPLLDTDDTYQHKKIPRAVRLAHAIQSAHEAWSSRGLDPIRQHREAAHRGVTSHYAMGRGGGADLAQANRAAAALCADAHAFLRRYVASAHPAV